MSQKQIKDKRINLSMTDELYEEITKEAEKVDLSLSAYCIQSIEKSLGKVQKIDPKLITIDPIDVYTQDIQDCLSKVGNTAAKLDRLIYTLSQKGNVAEYELKRLVDLSNQLREEEKEFVTNMATVYEDRAQIRKDVVKRVDKIVKKAIGVK